MDDGKTADAFYAMNRESVKELFWGKIKEKRMILIENAIELGGDEHRFKVQMIDEIVEIKDDLENLLKK